MARWTSGLIALNYTVERLNWRFVKKQVDEILAKEGYPDDARVRIVGTKNADSFSFDVAAWPITPYTFREEGITIDFYLEGTKNIDQYSNIKRGSGLLYGKAVQFCKDQKLDEVIILNRGGRICEGSVSNVFWIKDGTVFTIPLSEGPVGGVFRHYLLNKIDVHEKSVTMEELINADEIFLTNVIRGIQPVGRLRTSRFEQKVSRKIFMDLVQPLTMHD